MGVDNESHERQVDLGWALCLACEPWLPGRLAGRGDSQANRGTELALAGSHFGSGTARAVRCCARKPMKNRVACATPLQEMAPAVNSQANTGPELALAGSHRHKATKAYSHKAT